MTTPETKTNIRSWKGYATVLRELQKKPRSAAGLALDLGCNYNRLQILMGRMCELGLVHECNWLPPSRNGRWVPVWAFGRIGRMPNPSTGQLVERRPMGYRNRPELVAFSTIVNFLANAPASCKDICEATGCNRRALDNLLRHCEQIGLLRVAGWDCRDDMMGRPTALWTLSAGVRKRPPRPPAMTDQQRSERLRQKRRERAGHSRLAAVMAQIVQPSIGSC